MLALFTGCCCEKNKEQLAKDKEKEKAFCELYPKGGKVVHKLTGDTLMIVGRYVRASNLLVKNRELQEFTVGTFEVTKVVEDYEPISEEQL